MDKAKILIVDDEQAILNVIEAYLRPEGYQVHSVRDGLAALKAAQAFKPDLIVLDLMLPGMDGIEVLQKLRNLSNVYVILLTAKTEETDKVVGLSVGADDYLTKPFSPRELLARIKSALRRLQHPGPSTQRVQVIGKLRIDSGSRQVWLADRLIDLTPMEFTLLTTLAEHRNLALSREQLLEHAWGGDYFGDLRVVDVHVGHLRKKLGKGASIKTVRGIGYRLEAE